MSEKMQLGSDIGKYILGLMDMEPEYQEYFITFVDCCDKLQEKKTMSEQEQYTLSRKLIRTLAWFEFRLPLYWCSMVRHVMQHIVPKSVVFGQAWACINTHTHTHTHTRTHTYTYTHTHTHTHTHRQYDDR
jgi:hypothetical protein